MRRRHGALLLFVIARRSGSARGRPFSKKFTGNIPLATSRMRRRLCHAAHPLRFYHPNRENLYQACKARPSGTSCSNEGGVAVVRNGGSYTNSRSSVAAVLSAASSL